MAHIPIEHEATSCHLPWMSCLSIARLLPSILSGCPSANNLPVHSTLALWTPCFYGHALLQTKYRSPSIEIWLKNDSRYYGLSLFRTQNDVPRVSGIRRVDCTQLYTWVERSTKEVTIKAYCPRTPHSIPARDWTQTTWPRVHHAHH